jgi:protein-disulfide isomerase
MSNLKKFSRIAVTLLLLVAVLFAASKSLVAQGSASDFDKNMAKFLESEKGQEELGKAVQAYFTRMQEQARKQQADLMARQAEDQFKNPVKIPAGNSPSMGPENAKVTIIEFSDFQCGFCKRGSDTMKELLEKYPNDLRVVFKNLPRQPRAMPAAKAAMAAGKQGKFWEMHDALLNNQRNLTDAFFLAEAKRLELDVDKFRKDMESEAVANQIKDDIALAEQHGVQGTPGFFVNGVAVRGAMPLEHFEGLVDRWLEQS